MHQLSPLSRPPLRRRAVGLTVAALVAMATAGGGSAVAQTPLATTVAPQNVVNLSASATTEVTKDQLTLVFATTREGSDAQAVQGQLKQALDTALTEARKFAKPGQVEVQTGNFAIYPRYNPKGGTNGWTGRAELQVEGKDIATIAQLSGRIQTMTLASSGFSLSREAREKVEADVAAQAIARFKQRAEQVARQFGFGGWSLREVQLQTGEQGVVGQPLMRAQATRAMADDAALPVEAGKSSVTATVSGSVQLSAR